MNALKIIRLSAVLIAGCLAGCGANAASSATAVSPTEKVSAKSTPAATAQTAGPWKVAFQLPEVQHQVTVAGFLNEAFGITAGIAGETHYTSDGGKNWPLAQNNSMCRHGLEIVNETLAWTSGNGGNVRVTKDGGVTWQPVADVKMLGVSQYISFIDEKTGWIADETQLVATSDGGQTWTDVALPGEVRMIVAIGLRTASNGYVLDFTGTLYATQNAGKTWTALALNLEKKIFAISKMPMAVVRFTDSQNGVVIAGLEDSQGAMIALETSDSGKSWIRYTLPVKLGMLFLTRNADYLTVNGTDKTITVLHRLPSAGK